MIFCCTPLTRSKRRMMNDTRTLHAAQAEAVAMLADDPLLEAPEHALLEQQVQQMFEKAGAMN